MLVLLSAILQDNGVCIPSKCKSQAITLSIAPIYNNPHQWFSYCKVRMNFLALFKCFHKAESICLCRLWCHLYLADNNPLEKYIIKAVTLNMYGNWVVSLYVISVSINGADKSTVALPCRNLCSKFNVCQDWPSKPCKPILHCWKDSKFGSHSWRKWYSNYIIDQIYSIYTQ